MPYINLINASLVSSYSLPNGVTNSYVYDAFERLTSKIAYRHSVSYTYVSGSALVASESVSRYDGGVTNYAYTYNALGYIMAISKNGTTVAEYEYDALGQLVCEEYPVDSKAYVYTYDKSGNITAKNEYPYNANAGQKEYTLYLASQKVTLGSYDYSTSTWGDLLTNYNGTAITYDAIGNPSNWRNAISISWDKRELSSLTLAQNETLSFTYNSSGIRTQKNYINYNEQYSITHNYLLDGSTILKETVVNSSVTGTTTDTLYYYYDGSGIAGFEYNGAKYHYIKNLQGDIVEIYDANGIRAVQYTYDAWGNVISITGSLATTIGQLNPFRYRGYYYDTETGFYYLQSRYYDPTVGRFLNADAFVSTGQGILGNNMFAYCGNNPISYSDNSGYLRNYNVMMTGSGSIGYKEVFEYKVIQKFLFTSTEYQGKVYFYEDKPYNFYLDKSNRPSGFNPETDVMVGIFITNTNNPTFLIPYADELNPNCRKVVIKAMKEYDKDYNTPWERTADSLLTEWVEHMRYKSFSESARHVDFDNSDEDHGFGYFLKKAFKQKLS